MEKKQVDLNVPYDIHWFNYTAVPIDIVKRDMNTLEQLGCTHIQITAHENFGCLSVEILPICRRFETDEEFKKRCQQEENRLKEIEQREKSELDRLKRKYGEI